MRLVFLLLASLINIGVVAQNYLGLEGSVPSNWSASNNGLSISSKHYKMGSQSLKWNWSEGATITVDSPAGMANACKEYKGGMMLWIYNENAKDADLTFQFKNAAKQVQYHFNYHINFTGWRACWIRFDEDMFGAKTDKNLVTLTITAPGGKGEGTLFFDRMIFPDERVSDRVTPDAQLDYINPEMNYNHWAALWHWHSNYQYDIELPASVSMNDENALNEIRQRITTNIQGKALSSDRISEIRNEYNSLGISNTADGITGVAFVPADEYVAANGDKRLDDLDVLVYDMAKAWHHNQASDFDELFINVLDWLYDQGLTVGSGIGANHHYGYSFRGFPKAIWLMQDALKSAGKFDEAFEMIQYWTGVPEIRQFPEADNFQGVVDAWNTIINGRLMAIMLRDNSPELVRDMQSFKRWMDASMQYSVGVMGGFKPDGAGFHHGMIYAGYMNGGYGGLSELLCYVGNTLYNLSDQSRSNFRQALDIHSWYANHRSIVNSVCGRKPMNQNLGTGAINGYAYLAKATNPVDAEAASHYMRLTKYKKELYDEFKAMGIKTSAAPTGNVSINYGALNLHRRNNWLVATKGFNKIVTGTEIYASNNRYGRYQSYGAIQILASGNPVTAEKSGFEMKGWDWNRFPGTTSIHLPYDLLNLASSKINERSEKSEFAGACSQDGNGIFGMYLDENNHTNYTDDFVARKSVFAFDNRIVCLGSNISNSNGSFNTETTLFQNSLSNTSDKLFVNGEQIAQFPYDHSIITNQPQLLMDTKGQGYYVVDGDVKIAKGQQESRDNKNKSVNYGNFATAWINHGKAPNHAGYEYAILVQTNIADLEQFKLDMASESAPYKVVRKDKVAHIVCDASSKTTGYVLFEANDDVSSSHVKACSYPCLIMVNDKSNGELKLTFADPSINMPVPDGLISSDDVAERLIRITINGHYSLADNYVNCRLVELGNTSTTLEFTAIHGLPIEVELQKNTSAHSGSKVSDKAFYVYPNPVDDVLNYSPLAGIDSVSVLSLDGKLLINSDPGGSLYVGELNPGVYFLRININNQQQLFRFIKA